MNGGHFKLGLFVTVAGGLLVGFLLMLGALDRFKPRVMTETYFLESIQNLQPGAAVRFRGLQVGAVDTIEFAASAYTEAANATTPGTYRSYIVVRMKLYAQTLVHAGVHLDAVATTFEANVRQGLRARLSSTGLGGPTFVEIDFLDPEAFRPPPIEWTPEHIYIPSAPSTVVSMIDALATILRLVNELSIVEEFAATGEDLRRVLDKIESSDLLATSESAMAELREASAEARVLLGDPRLDQIMDDAGATLEGARTLLEKDRGEIEQLIRDMSRMAGALDRAGTSLDTLATNVNDSDLIPEMRILAGELGPAGRDLSDLAQRLERLVRGNEQQIADAIRSLRDAALELQTLLEELKTNPSRILSDPPPKGTPGGGS